jgi:electron transfer flavoprotein beta subunit
LDPLKFGVLVKLEPDFSEGNVSYNADGTLNRAETKSILGPHSAVACSAAFYGKVKFGAKVMVGTMGPPIADSALQQAQMICDADELHLYSDRLFAGADTLATAEVLKTGVEKATIGKADIVFSGHRASDGETGQTGPQTAWKLGYSFLGNVIDYDLDPEKRLIRAKRLISLQGFHDVIEEVESPLPAFLALDPSYKPFFHKVSERLAEQKYLKEARERARDYKKYLTVFNVQQLGVDPKKVGLPGSPTIVYKVEKIPKAMASRKAQVIDGSDAASIRGVAEKIYQVLGGDVK